MVDPLSIAAATAVRWVTPDLQKKFKDFMAKDQMPSLYKAVVGHMEGLPHASKHAVTHVFSLESPQQTLTEFLATGTLDESALQEEITGLFEADFGDDATAFAASFIEAVKRTGHKAAASDRAAMRLTARAAASEMVLPELERVAAGQDALRASVEALGAPRAVSVAPSRQIGLLLGRQLGHDVEEILRELDAADSAAAQRCSSISGVRTPTARCSSACRRRGSRRAAPRSGRRSGG